MSPDMILRPVGADDADQLLAWRNHPDIARQSRNSAVIDRPGHVAWLDRMIRSPDCLFWIGETGGQACGFVRFNRDGEAWEVSIALAPGLSGRGLGRALLRAGVAALRAQMPGATVSAAVRPGNAASEALFRGAGFVQAEKTGEDGFLRFTLA